MKNDKQLNRILAAIVFIISTIVYLKTVAPTTSFWDCGEFIACSYILGVPHPPGAPLYILVGRIFSIIPFAEDIGLRVNIISSLASSITIMFLYLIIVRLITMFRGAPQNLYDRIFLYSSGVIGSLLLAFSDTFWFNAVEAEVYAISLLFTAIVFWLILVWYEKADDSNSDRYLLMIAYCIGLAIGVHLLSILALPTVGLIIYFRKFKLNPISFLIFAAVVGIAIFAIYPGLIKFIPIMALKFSAWIFVILILSLLVGIYFAVTSKVRIASLIIFSVTLITLAMSTYAVLYIRSNLDPAIDENDPETLEKMVSYLNREQYGDWGIIERRAPLWKYQIEKMYIRYFGWQFIGQGTSLGADRRIMENYSWKGLYMLPFIVGLIGMFYHFQKDWKHAFPVLTLFIITGIAIVIYLNQDDPQPRERDYVYGGSFFAFAIWIGAGVYAILEWVNNAVQNNLYLRNVALAITVICLLFVLPINSFAYNYHSHNRSGNYVAYDYSYNILQSCEPNAILFTNGDNDTFPLWFLQNVYNIRTDVRVVNLSLLNTSWYIYQLKNEEPRVPISLPDPTIENIQPVLLPKDRRLVRIKVPKEAYQRDMGDVLERKELITPDEEPPELSFELKPTLVGKAIRVQDIMVLNIIQANQFRRPIYFALTVSRENQLNMFKYLRMDGLVFKLVTYTGEQVSAINLQANLFDKFQFRGLNDDKLYFNENIKGLLRNYQGAFFSLAQSYARDKSYDKMTETFDKLTTVMPDSVIPMRDDLVYNMGFLYYQAGRKDEFKKRIDKLVEKGGGSNEDKIRYASIYSQLYDENEKAEAIAMKVIEDAPNYTQAYYWLLRFYSNSKQFDKGIKLLEDWLVRNPDDKTAKSQLEMFKQLASLDTAKNTSSPDSISKN